MTTKKCRKPDSTTVELENFVSFSEIGGLTEHIRTLKELIIFPLIYQNVYSKFKIRPPRGVLFYGPPGTGKTLVAGALAKECSKEIHGKVNFFSRKGADILNKWVGESEEKLRELFTEAAESHPSIIFFDEIDGLAPIRSSKQDQVHASVVATLLALMDGLDKLPGVVVIGATNRIDAIDPALRRPGRFDRELYFPLPAYNARKEILEVHVSSWTVKPKPTFLAYLADITAGYSGSDLQALCSEAVMSCLRRNYPQIHSSKINIRMRSLKVGESDFITARTAIMPSANREATPMRRFSPIIQPLLQRQLNQVLLHLQTMSPHFTDPNYKYNIGSKRYAGRLLLIGNPNQGHNTHMAPAILHALEHLPSYIIDIQALYKSASRTAEEICVQKLTQARLNLPSIVLAYRLDEWWDIVEESTRAVVISMFEDLHAGLPLLIIATATNDLPFSLTNFFSAPGSVVHNMENPNEDERASFFFALFMQNALNKCKLSTQTTQAKPTLDCGLSYLNEGSMESENRNFDENTFMPVFHVKEQSAKQDLTKGQTNNLHKNSRRSRKKSECKTENDEGPSGGVKRKCSFTDSDRPHKMQKTSDSNLHKKFAIHAWSPLFSFAKKIKESLTNVTNKNLETDRKIETHYVNDNFSDDSQNNELEKTLQADSEMEKKYLNNKKFKKNLIHKSCRNCNPNDVIIPGDSKVSHIERLKYLYRRTITVTSNNKPVANLELLYDMLATCINRENQNVPTMLENIGNILTDFESKQTEALVDY